MNNLPLVSIIIPTFNRAHIIEETLDSILAQTYKNWECIVVDDGSTDDTEEVMAEYMAKDARFQYHHRPEDRLPGGNAARNYGFEVSKGEYIQWFDSDDLMDVEKLKVKVQTIISYNVDFVISKTKFFNKPNDIPYPYNYYDHEINFLSFSTTHISWFTPDMLLKKKIAAKISFNEKLKAGQEFNYSCKLLLITNKIKKIDRVLTHRRHTENSIGSVRRKTNEKYLYTRFQSYWLNYKDISQYTDNAQFNKHSLIVCVSCYLRSDKSFKLPDKFYKELYRVFGIKIFYFFASKWSKYFFNKYNYFYQKFKK